MFFQVSPPKKIKKDNHIQKNIENEEMEVLTLAPFTANPKIFFENIPVKKMASKKIIIRNPMNFDLQISIKHQFPEELNTTFSWMTQEIRKESEVLLELTWIPDNEGSWRYTFMVCDGAKIKRDIPVVFKSLESKRRKGVSKLKSTYSTKKVKSPSPVKYKKSPIKRQIPNILISNPGVFESLKENISPELNNQNIYPKFHDALTDIDRRNTYTAFKPNRRSTILNKQSNENDEKFDDSLEKDKPLELSKELFFSNSFNFSPHNSISFLPELSSTGEKSKNESLSFTGKRMKLFSIENLSPHLDQNITMHQTENIKHLNISSETYIKDIDHVAHFQLNKDFSTATYVKELTNISTETYVKDLSGVSTFVQSKSNLSGIEVKGIIEANLWAHPKPVKTKKLDFEFDRGTKRKSEATFNITPSKKPFIASSRLKDFSKTLKHGSTNFVSNNPLGAPNILDIITGNIDPFLSGGLYYTEEWVEEQEKCFKKWLNALLTPPEELNTAENPVTDVAVIWQKCKKNMESMENKTLTKEQIANKYSNNKLAIVRKTAKALYRSPEIVNVLTKVINSVEKGKFEIRRDKDLHLDIGLQSEIITILLSYNLLWLRIGLETIYNEIIPMISNSDTVALSAFIIERFFRDPHLLKKHRTVYTHKYTIDIKKFILKKFFALVYLLDQGKVKKIIAHDPCLFRKNSEIKESRDVLLKFSRETLQAIGDVTKPLKSLGYIVNYKQTYIEEFNYAVNCLGVDLRDGVRLTKLMEIILLRNDLTKNLRVPSISRLQKVYNMKMVFDSLEKSGFTLIGDIEPKDLVDGHKEKTLSFLWQIIYKFQTPYMIKFATRIQNWWRSLNIVIKRRKLQKIWQQKDNAARKIQLWYRKQIFLKKINNLIKVYNKMKQHLKMEKSVIKIQSYFKMYQQRKRFLIIKRSVVLIQHHSRLWLEKRKSIAAIKIQSYFKMYIVRKYYKQLKFAVIIIENRYLANKLMIEEREKFEKLKYATLIIQQRYRMKKIGQVDRINYLKIKWATTFIQKKYRAKKLMENERQKFLIKKVATINIQQWYRAKLLGRKVRKDYEKLKNATVVIQKRIRANLEMKREKENYEKLRFVVINIQRKFRAKLIARKHYEYYQNLRKAVIFIQEKFRANLEMKNTMEKYKNLKNKVIFIQRKFRAKLLMRQEMKKYQNQRKAIITIQVRFRAILAMKIMRKNYQTQREIIIKIQRRFRANREMRKQLEEYKRLKSVVIFVQRKFRAKLAMRKDLTRFQTLKDAAIVIQRQFRARKTMKKDLHYYKKLKKATILIQRRFRANREMRKQLEEYKRFKSVVIFVQRKFRAKLAMRKDLTRFQTLKDAAIVIQRQFRAKQTMKKDLHYYGKLKKATVLIQRKFRAKLEMRKDLNKYKTLKAATITIQRRFREKLIIRKEIVAYRNLRNATIFVQRTFRAKLARRRTFEHYQKLKEATIIIQRRFRANLKMKLQMKAYKQIRKSVILIQSKFRAKLAMEKYKKSLEKSVILVQRRFRANRQMRKQLEEYKRLKAVVIFVQRKFRAKLAMRKDLKRFQTLKQAVIIIQRQFRARNTMKKDLHYYKKLKKATILIQRRFRAKITMKRDKKKFQLLKTVTITIQQWFRANRAMKVALGNYQKLKKATIFVQQKFRAKMARREAVEKYGPEIQRRWRILAIKTKAAITIQAHWRGHKARCQEAPQLIKIRQKAQQANLNAKPQNTIKFICQESLNILDQDNVTMKELFKALKDLEYGIRVSKETCERFSEILSDRLYILIISSGRSLPDEKLLIIETLILINFAKYEKSRPHAFLPQYFNDILKVMWHWSDKEGMVFPQLCTLLWIFAQNPDYQRKMHSIPNFSQILEKIRNCCIRKQKMVLKIDRGISAFTPYEHYEPHRRLPALEPDWGIEFKHQPRTFLNSVFAYKCLKQYF